ncbi:MAG: sporulation integral membrane protein YtvI [Desulfotomaculaceae bacterium]
MRDFYKKHWNMIINVAILAATLIIAAVAFKLVIPYFLPFVLGLILAVAIDPVVNLFLRFKMSRVAATGMAMLVTLGILTVVIWLAILTLIVELSSFLANLPHITRIIETQSLLLAEKLQSVTEALPPEFAGQFNKNIENLTAILSDKISLLVREILASITTLPTLLLIVVIMLIATFFLSKDLVKIKKQIASLIPYEFHSKLRIMSDHLYWASIGFIKAQIILSVISALIIMVGLLFLKTDYIVTISLLGGLFSPVPVLGVGVVFIPLIIFHLMMGNNFLALWLLILFAVVVVIKHSLEPKILGQNMGIAPLSVLVSLYAGYELIGVYGFILGPFTLITYNALLKAKAFAWIFQDEIQPLVYEDPDNDD